MALPFRVKTNDNHFHNSVIEYPNKATKDATPADVMLWEILKELQQMNKMLSKINKNGDNNTEYLKLNNLIL